MRLLHQFLAVGKKQNILEPFAVVVEQLAERDTHARLARSGGQHEQTTAMLPVEPFHQTLDGGFLIGAVGDFIVYRQVGNRGATPFLNQIFQVVVTVEGDDGSRRIVESVYHLCSVSVGVINYRAHAILLLQAICILDGLFASRFRAVDGAFGFYHRQRFAVLAKEHIVGVADA